MIKRTRREYLAFSKKKKKRGYEVSVINECGVPLILAIEILNVGFCCYERWIEKCYMPS